MHIKPKAGRYDSWCKFYFQLVKTSVENNIYDSPSHREIISPKTSPTIQVPTKVRPQLPVEPIIRMPERTPYANDVKQLINVQHNFQRMMENKLPGPPLVPIINSSRSLSETEAKNLLDDLNRGSNNILRSPTALLPGTPLMPGTKPFVPPELLSEYSRLGLLQSNKIHDILKDVLTRKRLIEDTNTSPQKEAKVADVERDDKNAHGRSSPVGEGDQDTLPSFLQYIGKELETMPFDFQEKAKKEIFRVITDLKKQSMFMVPHHWQLGSVQQPTPTRQQWERQQWG